MAMEKRNVVEGGRTPPTTEKQAADVDAAAAGFRHDKKSKEPRDGRKDAKAGR